MSSSTNSLGDVASITEYETCRYRHCDETYVTGVSDTAPYCSMTCRRRATALGIFDDIKHDRRFCNNCYRQIREQFEQGRWLRSRKVRTTVWYVNRPDRKHPVYTKSPDDPFAYFKEDDNRQGLPLQSQPTKHTVRGTSDRLSLSDPSRHNYQTADDPTPSAVCVCGATHHMTTQRPIKLDQMMEHAKRLSDALSTLEAEDNHEPTHDRDILLDEIRARKTDPNNHTPDQHIFINAIAEAIRNEPD